MKCADPTEPHNSSEESGFPPEDECLFCGKSINVKRGLRIVAQQERGVLLTPPTSAGRRNSTRITIRTATRRTLLLEYWGEDCLWNPETVERAKNAGLSGRHPWFCQQCGDRVCRTCGRPLIYPVGSDVIHDDGEIRHVPIWPFHVGCDNRKCHNHGVRRKV